MNSSNSSPVRSSWDILTPPGSPAASMSADPQLEQMISEGFADWGLLSTDAASASSPPAPFSPLHAPQKRSQSEALAQPLPAQSKRSKATTDDDVTDEDLKEILSKVIWSTIKQPPAEGETKRCFSNRFSAAKTRKMQAFRLLYLEYIGQRFNPPLPTFEKHSSGLVKMKSKPQRKLEQEERAEKNKLSALESRKKKKEYQRFLEEKANEALAQNECTTIFADLIRKPDTRRLKESFNNHLKTLEAYQEDLKRLKAIRAEK
jgi:hypothetical protein